MFSSFVGKWGKFSPKIEIFIIFRENPGEFSVIYDFAPAPFVIYEEKIPKYFYQRRD
jgi:hypothetical protein